MSGFFKLIGGLFSGITGLIGGLFGGILGFVGGLFGGKKKGGEFFLEMEDAKGVSAESAPAASASAASKAAAAPAAKAAAPAAKAAAPAAKAAASSPAPAPTPAVAIAAVNSLASQENFSTKHLVSNGTVSRRRPGANMASYLNMARQVRG